jgi:quercetin dioxygenase-like cupin family protein
MDVIDLHKAFRRLETPWTPRIVGEVNGFHAKVARLEGEFVWHSHAEEDELFLVMEGQLRLRLRDGDDVVLRPGQLYVVPRGVEHLPVAEPYAHVLLFEPASTLNTGDATDERTVEHPEWI